MCCYCFAVLRFGPFKHLVDDSYCGLLDVGDRYVVPFYSANVESVIVPLALSPTDLAEGEFC